MGVDYSPPRSVRATPFHFIKQVEKAFEHPGTHPVGRSKIDVVLLF
jgi:hypothetical protein